MTQPLTEPDGLTANQRRDRELVAEFRRREAAIEKLIVSGGRNSLRLALEDQARLAKRAPHLFGVDQHGQPFVRETGE